MKHEDLTLVANHLYTQNMKRIFLRNKGRERVPSLQYDQMNTENSSEVFIYTHLNLLGIKIAQ